MKAFTFRSPIMVVPALAIAISPARAQDAPAPAPQAKSSAVEITPFVAFARAGHPPSALPSAFRSPRTSASRRRLVSGAARAV